MMAMESAFFAPFFRQNSEQAPPMKPSQILRSFLLAAGSSLLAISSASAAIVLNDVILIDFGKSGAGWTGSNGPGAQTTGNWNNISATNDSGSVIGSSFDGQTFNLISDLIRYSDGASTGVGFTGAEAVHLNGSGIGGADVSQNSPQLSFSSSGLIPYSAERDVFFTATAFTFTFTGLNDALTYNLEALARFNNLAGPVPSAPARNARNWTLQLGVLGEEQTISVDPDVNPSSIIAFNNVSTNGAGTITLTLFGATTAGDLAHINALELTAIPEPSAALLGGLGLLALLRRRR